MRRMNCDSPIHRVERHLGYGWRCLTLVVAGQCGFGLGATPTPIANLEAVCARYGAAPQAFLLVPVVGAFLIDIPPTQSSSACL
jgi:sodium--glutamate symport carrier gltS